MVVLNSRRAVFEITPRKLLRFKGSTLEELGILQIVVRGAEGEPIKRRTRSQTQSARYLCPELAFADIDRYKSQQIASMWFMGCLILDFVIWMLLGFNNVERFYDDLDTSVFDTAFSGGINDRTRAMVRNFEETVQHWMGHFLRGRKGSKPNLINDLLQLAKDKLLVSTTTNLLPTSDKTRAHRRANAREICGDLGTMLQKAGRDSSYLYSAGDWKDLRSPPPINALTHSVSGPSPARVPGQNTKVCDNCALDFEFHFMI